MQAQALNQTKNIPKNESKTLYHILFIIGFVHLLNDAIQALVPAMFPILQQSMGLTFTQLGMIAFALNLTASVIQPIVGTYTDRNSSPYALPIGLSFTFFGVLGLAFAPSFSIVIISVIFIGIGSATFHPEGSRVAYMAAGERRGLAQSIYQVGGNSGQALAPIITAIVLVPLGQFGSIWFTLVAAIAIALLFYIAKWYSAEMKKNVKSIQLKRHSTEYHPSTTTRKVVTLAMILLIFLVFARSLFHAGLTNFYAFFAIETYSISIQQAQIYLFLFLAFGAIGTFAGGPLADRFGKKTILIISMLGSAPLSLLLPHVTPVIAYPLISIIGFIILSSFSVAVVYAQELVPGKIGLVSGLIVGLAFGMGAIGSVILGVLADVIGLNNTIFITVAIPIVGLCSFFLPNDQWITDNIQS
ncbi:MFS transporter [Halalkalibacter hemicellulosilyticus]|uniref:Fosmidomycin resistance protein n=1 Tax=Halalkalibacter hemicellulosilyticusJCM 9152 TaxID=1236971 RepID=W4QEW9_9BACI|nr:MFS transporter [Halalkalibacter hemicellulosilyticus]GAE30616.1 fosmidomycin resistance protein [Halalkalibacter hemicellulosilyticusJCM 9152]